MASAICVADARSFPDLLGRLTLASDAMGQVTNVGSALGTGQVRNNVAGYTLEVPEVSGTRKFREHGVIDHLGIRDLHRGCRSNDAWTGHGDGTTASTKVSISA